MDQWIRAPCIHPTLARQARHALTCVGPSRVCWACVHAWGRPGEGLSCWVCMHAWGWPGPVTLPPSMPACPQTNVVSAMEDNAFLCFYELTTPLLACLYGMDANATWNAKDKRDFGDWMAPSSWLKALEVAGLVMVREGGEGWGGGGGAGHCFLCAWGGCSWCV